MRGKLAVGMIALVGIICGCRSVLLTSDPDQASVWTTRNRYVATTPIDIKVKDQPRSFIVKKSGYVNQNVEILPSSPDVVHVKLEKEVPPPPPPPPPKVYSGQILMDVVPTAKGLSVEQTSVYAEENVIERSPNVKAVRRLTDLSENRWVGNFCLFVDGGRVLMDILDRELVEDGRELFFSNLWDINAKTGGAMQRRTEGKYFDADTCFSPDGEFIYFSSNRSGKKSIFRQSVSGTKGLGLITAGVTSDTRPEVSQDGTTIFYTAEMQGSRIPQIWSQPLSPGLPMQLREGAGARCSPDGKLVMFSAIDRNTGKTKIWTMSPDSSQPIQLTQAADCNDIDACWSPDGKQILFASDRGQANGVQNFDIWLINSDGSNPKQLTTNGSRDDKPIFSKDGKAVYFRSNRGMKWDIWVMELASAGDAK